MRIFLVGMPGSGKSTVSKQLAILANLNFIDLDKVIEQDAGKSITEIFEITGEEGFRKLEQKALRKVIADHENIIISCGGGTPCFFDNLSLMKKHGKTIYINVPEKILLERTSKSSKRPLLVGNHAEKLSALLRDREKYYKQADILLNTNGSESSEVARKIHSILQLES